MSTIFGIINKNGEAIDLTMATKMQTSLLRSAIDGKSMYVNGEVMLGHHKLIVHRRQTYEQQPFEYDDYIITCDARIDNTEDLIQEMELDQSLNITDSFIILKAYKKWGNDCVNHLEGEFAFAIWNKLTKTFYGASDHIGFRTFYYYENSQIFAFASRIKGIESIKTEALKINKEIFFDQYTHYRYPITYDKNIHVLQSAHYLLLIKKSKLTIARYWMARQKKRYNFNHHQDWYDCLLKLITKKIENQIDSDYPIGIMLSGGLDSSFIAAIACKLLKEKNKKLLAFSIVLPEKYEGPDKDERFYIEKLKEHFDNLEVHYVSIPDQIGPYSNLVETFNRVEAPVNPMHYVETVSFELAEKFNVRTLLSGIGGDMTVSNNGNGVIYQYLTRFRFLKAFELLFKLYKIEKATLFRQVKYEILSHNPFLRKIRNLIKTEDQAFFPLSKIIIKRLNKFSKPSGNKKALEVEINDGELGHSILLNRKQAQALKLEHLSPMLSKEICELFFDLPDEQHLLNGVRRSFIKKTMKDMVPQEILNRTDKWVISPDHNKRIAAIKNKRLDHLFKQRDQIEKFTGIDFLLLAKSITQITNTEFKTDWGIDPRIYYIPGFIIASEFYLWLNSKEKINEYISN